MAAPKELKIEVTPDFAKSKSLCRKALPNVNKKQMLNGKDVQENLISLKVKMREKERGRKKAGRGKATEVGEREGRDSKRQGRG